LTVIGSFGFILNENDALIKADYFISNSLKAKAKMN